MSIEDRLARSASTLDAAIESRVGGGGRPRREHRWVAAAAAMVLVVGGLAGVATLRDRSSQVTLQDPSAQSPVVHTTSLVPTVVEPESGSALTTPVPSDVQALVVSSLPGWRVDATSGFLPVTAVPSTECPGCGADRLILVGDGGLSGPVFTAWSVDVPVAMDDFGHVAMVGSFEGWATSSPVGTPLSEMRVTAAWRLGDGPGALTAFVEAKGLSEAQVLEWAALLSWQYRVPTMTVRPAGFTVVDAPTASAVEVGSVLVSSERATIELYAINTGVHGLVDWRSIGQLLRWTSEPRVVDGVDVALDPPEPVDERPITTISATWISGGWAYVAIGHIFDSEAEFLDAVRALQITNPSTYAAATADAADYYLSEWVITTGWNVISVNPDQTTPTSDQTG